MKTEYSFDDYLLRVTDKWVKTFGTVLKLIKHKSRPLPKVVKNIIVFSYGAIGDVTMQTVMVRILKYNYPDSTITLAARRHGKVIAEFSPDIDEFETVEDMNGRYFGLKQAILHPMKFLNVINNFKHKKYDLGISDIGTIISILTFKLLKVKFIASYDFLGSGALMDAFILRDKKPRHVVDDRINLLAKLGLKTPKRLCRPLLQLSYKHIEDNRIFKEQHHLQEDSIIIGIHPGASARMKMWMKYNLLVEKIAGLHNDKIVLFIFNGLNEDDIISPIVEAAKKSKVNSVVIKESLENYIRILDLCSLVICNDSGCGHITAAFDKRLVTIFTSSVPQLFKPYSEKAINITPHVSCSPCFEFCSQKSYKCVESISVEEVFSAVVKQLEYIKLEKSRNEHEE